MKIKLKYIGSSILITLSFVFCIGVISSIGMIVIENSSEHLALISGIAQALYLLLVILIFKVKKVDTQNTYGLNSVPFKEYLLPLTAAFSFSAFSNIVQAAAPIPQELIGGMSGDIITVVHAFLGGLIFALSYVKTKSLFPAIAAHVFGNIGGYIPTVTNRFPVTIQYVTAIGFLTAAIVFCVILTRKKRFSYLSAALL